MPVIKPISILRNQARSIASYCHEQDEPVYLTTNGVGDLAVMSIEHYEHLMARVELLEQLATAQTQAAQGARGPAHAQLMRQLRRQVRGA